MEKKKGHFKKECRFYKKLKIEENVESKILNIIENVSEIVAIVSPLNIGMVTECNLATIESYDDWWYDSRVTVRVCNEKTLFKDYVIAKQDEFILMGNHNKEKVHGRGVVELQFTSGKKLTLINIFHVPEMRKNMISANLLSKNGLKTIIEAGKLIVTKDSVLLERVTPVMSYLNLISIK